MKKALVGILLVVALVAAAPAAYANCCALCWHMPNPAACVPACCGFQKTTAPEPEPEPSGDDDVEEVISDLVQQCDAPRTERDQYGTSNRCEEFHDGEGRAQSLFEELPALVCADG